MKEVNLSFQTFRKIFSYIVDRFLNYSILAYSKYEKMISVILNETPQFTLNLQEAGCIKEELEFVLNFLALHNNDRNIPIGIAYQKEQSEYTIIIKTEKMAFLLENICVNSKNIAEASYHELLQFMSDETSATIMLKILQNPNSTKIEPKVIYELCRRKEMEGTLIKCMREREIVEMAERRRLNNERWELEEEQEELEAEKQHIEYENKVKQEAEKKYREERQNAAHAGHATTDGIQEIIKIMFEARISVTPNKKTSEIIASITKELDGVIDDKNKRNANKNDILRKFATKYNIQNLQAMQDTLSYFVAMSGGQIKAWCYKFKKEPKK